MSHSQVSLRHDEAGWWVLSSLYDGGPPISFLFRETAWVCFKWRVEELFRQQDSHLETLEVRNDPHRKA